MNWEEKYMKLKDQFDQFTYIISHDLNAPLRAISNLSEWISEDLQETENEDVKQNLNLLMSRVKVLNKMIDAVGSTSRIARFQLEKVVFKPKDVVIEEVNALFRKDEIDLTIKGEFPDIHGYEEKFQSVLHELLKNCKQFSDSDRVKIEITGRIQSQNFFELEITDFGKGIPSSTLAKVFNLFYQVDPSNKDHGVGFGLFYVAQIIDFIGGEIELESTENELTTVRINWPIKD